MPPPSYMLWVSALCSPSKRFLNHFACRSTHLPAPNLLASDQTTVDSLSERLADEAPLDRAGLDQVENRSQRTSEFEALRGLYVALGQVAIMKDEDAGNITVASEVCRNGHVELRRIQIRQVEKAKRRLVAVNTLNLLVPVSGPQGPQDEVGPVCSRKQSEPVNAAVLTNPVPHLHVIGVCVFGKSGRLGLLGGEEALLLLSEFEKPPRGFTVRLRHTQYYNFLDLKAIRDISTYVLSFCPKRAESWSYDAGLKASWGMRTNSLSFRAAATVSLPKWVR